MTAVPTDARFTPEQLATLERIEAADPAPESFDPIAALRRVLKLADSIERGEAGGVGQEGAARLIRVAVADSAAALGLYPAGEAGGAQ